MKNVIILVLISTFTAGLTFYGYSCKSAANEWYYPCWAVKSNNSIKVLDTESALGRYSKNTKILYLKDIALVHGHLCDGLVISYIEIKSVLEKLFTNGIVDRTDLRIVSKNGPCWVDAASMMTGARINFGTLSIDPKIGDGFIIQRISTGETYDVHLKEGIFPKEQADLENKIRKQREEGKQVSAEDINKVEKMQNELSKKLLNSLPDKILEIKNLSDK